MSNKASEDAQARVRAIFGDSVDVKPIKPPEPENTDSTVVELLTRVCYFYPQYDLEAADKLTEAQVTALLVQAERQRAIDFYNHTLIAAAPHSKKGKLVEKLIKQYRKILEE